MEKKQGFTLIELSIVLVIIALIAAGVLVGRELIHQAELRAVLREYNSFDTAVNTYRDKFRALPGDDPQAYNYFGDACGTNNITALTSCNGNGNGIVLDLDAQEGPKLWEHLSRAELIEGAYTGVCNGDLGGCQYIAGDTAPPSRSGNTWIAASRFALAPTRYDGRNYFVLVSRTSSGYPYPSSITTWQDMALPVVDMFGLDSKIDDGLPNSGKVGGMHSYGNFTPACVADANADTPYNVNTTAKCTGFFPFSSGG